MNLGGTLKKVFGKPYTSIGPEEAAALVAGGGSCSTFGSRPNGVPGTHPGPGTSRSLAGSRKCRRIAR